MSEKMDVILTSENSHFEDDVQVNCHKCKKKLFARPYSSKVYKCKTFVCLDCLSEEA